jgi:hypothetical protein
MTDRCAGGRPTGAMRDQGVTVIVPVIDGWMSQWNA